VRSRNTRFTAKPASNSEDPSVNEEERGLIETLDELALFQDLRADLLPELKKLIEGRAPTKDILQAARAAAVARLASLAVMDEDSKTALSAIKELLDRTEGKVSEKREVTHALAKLKDEELDALVMSSIQEDED
jgi:ABC-type transporter Mla subunit MlaD